MPLARRMSGRKVPVGQGEQRKAELRVVIMANGDDRDRPVMLKAKKSVIYRKAKGSGLLRSEGTHDSAGSTHVGEADGDSQPNHLGAAEEPLEMLELAKRALEDGRRVLPGRHLTVRRRRRELVGRVEARSLGLLRVERAEVVDRQVRDGGFVDGGDAVDDGDSGLLLALREQKPASVRCKSDRLHRWNSGAGSREQPHLGLSCRLKMKKRATKMKSEMRPRTIIR
jgi:hypothetical protein